MEAAGHMWVGVDISPAMLAIAREREDGNELILGDLGQGLPFRYGLQSWVVVGLWCCLVAC